MLVRTKQKEAVRKVPPTQNSHVTYMAPASASSISPLALNREFFLDAYSKGKWNLSNVQCPSCLENTGFMPAPTCYVEGPRRKLVEEYGKLPHWKDKSIFKKIIGQIRKAFEVTGVSISIIDTVKTSVKYETLLDMSDIPRNVSLDGHAILSHGYFLLLDASKDWRTSQNPFVTGVPYIKFYCGVPLVVKNQIIGVLAIFDPFTKPKFEEASCKQLHVYSKEIMGILNTPIEELQEKLKQPSSSNNDLRELRLKLGRATSTRSMATTVFERDGSGGPYSQNHNFRFTRALNDTSEYKGGLNDSSPWSKLIKAGNLKSAAMTLTKSIVSHYSIDFVYILEIRIAEPYLIESEFFPSDVTKIEAENYRHANKLTKNRKQDTNIITRIIGLYGSCYSALNFENAIHYSALISEFGIEYKDMKQSSIYNRGIIMPFYRHNSKIIRRSKVSDKSVIDVYLRSGGYLIGTFNESLDNSISPDVVAKIFHNCGTLRKIYIS